MGYMAYKFSFITENIINFFINFYFFSKNSQPKFQKTNKKLFILQAFTKL